MDKQEYLQLIIASVAGVSLIFGIAMTFGTRVYLNRSRRRWRYIELIWGVDNEWYRGKKFDFLMAGIFVAGATFTAWRMKAGLQTKKQKQLGAYAYPELHKNGNYLKLLQEFSNFVLWEFARNAMLLLAMFLMLIGVGLDKGWW